MTLTSQQHKVTVPLRCFHCKYHHFVKCIIKSFSPICPDTRRNKIIFTVQYFLFTVFGHYMVLSVIWRQLAEILEVYSKGGNIFGVAPLAAIIILPQSVMVTSFQRSCLSSPKNFTSVVMFLKRNFLAFCSGL